MIPTLLPKTKRRWLQKASVLPVLVVSQETGTTCRNDRMSGDQDTGCPPHAPICLQANGQEPPLHEAGVHCVPCLPYFDHPGEPDWGCTPQKPLCVDLTIGQERPPNVIMEEEGDKNTHQQPKNWKCRPYPCSKTSKDPSIPDEGCTREQPSCVDALGNDPLWGNPGVQCTASNSNKRNLRADAGTTIVEEDSNSTSWSLSSSTSSWGLVHAFVERRRQPSRQEEDGGTGTTAKCLITGSVAASATPLCQGCPFGQTQKCQVPQQLSW